MFKLFNWPQILTGRAVFPQPYIFERNKKKKSTSLCYSLQDPNGTVTHDISYENVIRILHVMEACYKMINHMNNITQYHVSVVPWLYVVIWCDVLNMLKQMIINDITSDFFRFTTSQMCMAISVSFAICTNLFLKKKQQQQQKKQKQKQNKTKQNKTYKQN